MVFRFLLNALRYLIYILSSVVAITSIFFAYLYSLPSPSEEQIIKECKTEISSGNYSQYADPLGYCVEDYWKAAGASDGLWVASLVLFTIAAALFFVARKLKPNIKMRM